MENRPAAPVPAQSLGICQHRLFRPTQNLTADQQTLLRASRRFYGGWASAILAVLLMLAVGGYWLWNTTQEQRSGTLVDVVKTTAQRSCRRRWRICGPFKRGPCRRCRLWSEIRKPILSTACTRLALATYGDVSEHVRQVLIEGIARGPAGQGPNIVQGLRPVKDDALGTIAQRIEHSKTAQSASATPRLPCTWATSHPPADYWH